MKFVTVAEMQQIEREADASGLSYSEMMEHAGKGLADAVLDAYSHLKEKRVLGLVGSGNNGGDTLVALAHLANAGWEASAYIVRPRPESDPLVDRLLRAGGKLDYAERDSGFERLSVLLAEHSLVLDGVLGTGIRLPLKEEVAQVLETARNRIMDLPESYVVAVDCPSGVDSDSGEAAPETIPAELTVTMAAVKAGLLKFPAYQYVGRLKVVGIGIREADNETGATPEAWLAVKRFVPEQEDIWKMLPDRPLDSHKGTFGTALVVAGSLNYTGAVLLAGKAAYRTGAGLVTLAVPQPLHPALAGHFPEATWLLLPHEMGVIAPSAADVVTENISRATAILVGPGFGTEEATKEFLRRLLGGGQKSGRGGMGFVRQVKGDSGQETGKLPPFVVDADGLKLLSKLQDWSKRLPEQAVLTPHPGEMAIMTGLATSEIQADRLKTAEQYAQEWGHVVVLKGAFTVVASPDGSTAVIPVASPALARAGTGDVLSGLITGLRAQGLDGFSAAVAGAWIHAQAGLRAAEGLGNSASVLAGDVLDYITPVLSELYGNKANKKP